VPGRLRRASRAGSLVSSGARSPQRAFGTYGTFVPFSKGCAQVVYREKSGLAAGDPARGRDGELMRKTLLLAGILIFAGTARAQMGGSINNLGSISGGGSLNGVVGLNAGAVTSVSVPSSPTAAADSVVNLNSKNPGAFVPSTFTSYGEAVELGKLEASMKPTTLAEAARLAQEQKKTASKKSVIVVERNDDGKLVIAPAAKR
jgi:hypothetical protein